jgi:hypothetical protein
MDGVLYFILWFKKNSTEYIPIFQVILFQKRHVQTYCALTTGHAQWMTVHLHVLARTDIQVHAELFLYLPPCFIYLE